MTSQKQSASTSSFASTVLPSAEVIEFRPAKRIARQPRGFTKVSVSKMHCSKGEPETLFWDPSCRGFGLRALKSGRRTWIYQYRDEHNRTRRIALGDVSAVALDAARQAARQHAASVTQGANPSVERKGRKSAPNVLKVIESYLANAKTRQRPRSYQETERQLLKHAAPLHHDRAEAVRRSDIATLLDAVSKNSGRFAANRLRAALSALWSWGMRASLIQSDSNPVTFTLRHPEQARERTLRDEELRAIWAATDGDGDYARIVRLCILTGCRRGGLPERLRRRPNSQATKEAVLNRLEKIKITCSERTLMRDYRELGGAKWLRGVKPFSPGEDSSSPFLAVTVKTPRKYRRRLTSNN
jgi:hypothetical protein